MPLPFILGIGPIASVVGVAGLGSGVHGVLKMKEASDTMKSAERQHKQNIAKLEAKSESANKCLDLLGTLELNILKSFDEFSDTLEKIQNRPQFEEYTKVGGKLPKYDIESLENVSVGAGVLLGGLGGVAALSATTLGIGLLVGGVIFNVTGGKLSDKADEAYSQMKKAEKTINIACSYLTDLEKTAGRYYKSLETVKERYYASFNYVSHIVNIYHKTHWNEFTEQEKTATQNVVLLVGLLYKMCQVSLVNKAKNDGEMNTVNKTAVDDSIKNADQVLKELALM